MSVYVERVEQNPRGLVIGHLTADCRGELFVFAARLGLGVPTVHRRGEPDEFVPLTAAGWQDAISGGAFEIFRVDGEEHLRIPRAAEEAPDIVHDLTS